ncbi:uncharacterized protein LOC121867968 [Homarus americanus]|uniref:uncharacterized protein LOC121867968 n=1 Tax=Homarus americanus TaxID=6706 RepID=UPI001C48F771|nr:uncharacterized protein LOC121867968 [Homarus americanus]
MISPTVVTLMLVTLLGSDLALSGGQVQQVRKDAVHDNGVPEVLPYTTTHLQQPEVLPYTSTHVQEPEALAYTSTHQQEPEALPYTSTRLQEPEALAYTSTHQQEPEALPYTSTHLQEPEALPYTSTHVQEPEVFPYTSTHVQEPESLPYTGTHLQEPEGYRNTHLQSPKALRYSNEQVGEPERYRGTYVQEDESYKNPHLQEPKALAYTSSHIREPKMHKNAHLQQPTVGGYMGAHSLDPKDERELHPQDFEAPAYTRTHVYKLKGNREHRLQEQTKGLGYKSAHVHHSKGNRNTHVQKPKALAYMNTHVQKPKALAYTSSHVQEPKALAYTSSHVQNSEALRYMEPLQLHEPDKPYFDYHESANVTALLGKTAVLNCRVKNIGNKTVSWVRHRDIHLLTVGRFTYTSDQRFSARHSAGSEDWLLMVHYLQERDAGPYECQISTTPPMSHLIHLAVVEPETVIQGGPDVYINTGSRLALTCSVKYSPEPPAFIFWYHDDKLVSYERRPGDVVVSTETGSVTTSRLLVQFAEPRHTGLYTCSPANSKPQSVNVHVIAGDQPAAIVHENNSGAGTLLIPFHRSVFLNLLTLLTLLFLLTGEW